MSLRQRGITWALNLRTRKRRWRWLPRKCGHLWRDDEQMLEYLKRNRRLWAVALLGAAIAILVVWFSDAFQNCMDKSYYESSDYAPKKGVAQILAALGWARTCTGEFLKVDGEAITAFFTLVVGFFTAALWLSTDKLWKVTNATLDHAERTSISELRAYVSVKELSMEQFRNPDMLSIGSPTGSAPGGIHSYRICAYLENGGQTPTRNALVNINYVLRDSVLPADFDFPDGETTEFAAIGARGVFSTPGVFIPMDDIQKVTAETHKLYI
jgi:hypothetical protein